MTIVYYLGYPCLVETKTWDFHMKIETVSAEQFAEICDEVDVIERLHYGRCEIIVGSHEECGLVLFLVGDTDAVTMASEHGSASAMVALGMVPEAA